MNDIDPKIREHYSGGNERDRLTVGAGLVEFLRTQELLGRILPPPPAIVLDVGGGAGIHAAPLVDRGYDLHLIDPVPLHVEQARTVVGLASAEIGDARALKWPDAGVDAIMLLGPLYHLTERGDRIKALIEAARVLRPGGVLAAAAISRYASTLGGLFRAQLREPSFEAIVERDLADGQHRNPASVPEWFTTAYFHQPDDLVLEATEAGFEGVSMTAIEGPAGLLPDLDSWLEDDRELLMRTLRRIEDVPALLGMSPHLLVSGYRP